MKQIWLSSPLPILMLVILSWLIILFLKESLQLDLLIIFLSSVVSEEFSY